ncbi:unnamed protein product [Clonostachys chloroleuca]|uniref:Lipase-like C-terminal domain-containing protein n=1 Tax=Clonostachys chloroleuca TaxID=1926264 RepID=A0AA35M742_9HYPO|nr:unnamed protein product [Clonostachys chloroleuca]
MDPMTHPISDGNEGIVNLRRVTAAIREMGLPPKGFPIVFGSSIPGFSGWGRPLLGTVNYFGGFENLPLILSQLGYNVIVVRIGPISSNKERACEVFAQLTAGGFDLPATRTTFVPVNFGINHPAEYLGLVAGAETPRAVLYQASGNALPVDWTWSDTNKVNFICHSQGGTTVRCLIELLSGASDRNLTAFLGVDRQPWVNSVVTIGTPHKGTTVTDVVNDLIAPDGLGPLVDLITSCSFEDRQDRVYDLHLDHWGFANPLRQTYQAMRARIAPAVTTWWVGRYNGFFDNSVRGINALDSFAPDPSRHTYYFTMSFCATTPFPNETLTAQEINDFIALFPYSWNPFGVGGRVLARLQFLGPSARAALGWMISVANNHLGPLGYFSRIPPPGNQIPRPDVLPLLSYPAYAMGGRNIPPGVAMPGITSKEFQPNDGIVNTLSMDGPMTGPVNHGSFADQLAAGGSANSKATYWHLGTNSSIDHADQIGAFTNRVTNDEVQVMYMLFAELVNHLG